MSSLTITLDEEQLQQLQQAAAHLGITVEDLVRLDICESMERRQRMEKEMEAILQKNAELYRRLAQ